MLFQGWPGTSCWCWGLGFCLMVSYVWIDFSLSLELVVGLVNHFHGSKGTNLVSIFFLHSDKIVMMSMWWGLVEGRRNYIKCILQYSLTGMYFALACRGSVSDILTHPERMILLNIPDALSFTSKPRIWENKSLSFGKRPSLFRVKAPLTYRLLFHF